MQQSAGYVVATDVQEGFVDVVVRIDFGNGTVLQKQVQAGKGVTTAFDAVSQAFVVSSRDYGELGKYVYAVEDVVENQDKNGKYWQYYVDGKLAAVGVSVFVVEDDVVLDFKYEEPRFG
ncbi:MAG: DUF4430 domain-containing protein [Candidatus Micrarchaeia archaeon]